MFVSMYLHVSAVQLIKNWHLRCVYVVNVTNSLLLQTSGSIREQSSQVSNGAPDNELGKDTHCSENLSPLNSHSSKLGSGHSGIWVEVRYPSTCNRPASPSSSPPPSHFVLI
jgi:hypothetical protein